MNLRRTNKSAKVPNVKLRPAAPAARRSKDVTPPPTWVHEPGSDADIDASFVDLCPRPFREVVLCATGISDKTSLFKQAIELGATCIPDLTDKVTHLLAEEPGSAKYRCALENKISIMRPSWITSCHEVWLRGDDFDLAESIEEHRLPLFEGVILSLSGIEEVDRRTEINRLLRGQGGVYVKNLERPVKVTHLLCSSKQEEVTEKMRYAEKFNQRGEANIHLVWEEWFWDSLEFCGRFDEQAYHVSKPPPKRRSLPEPATSPPASSSPAPEERQNPTDSGNLLADDGDEEIASVKRVPAVMLQIWESLLRPRGFEIMGDKLVRSPSKSQTAREKVDLGLDDWRPPSRQTSPTRSKAEHVSRIASQRPGAPGAPAVPTSALSSFRRANSFAPASRSMSAPRQPFQRVATLPGCSSFLGRRTASVHVGGDDAAAPVASTSSVNASSPRKGQMTSDGEPSASSSSSGSSNLFAGLKFRTLGEARCQNVRTALEEGGGSLVSDDAPDEEVDYIIVRLISGSSLYRAEGDERVRHKYRTECWLERCIFQERVCEPTEHVSFSPLKIRTPIDGAENINLSFSGLDQSEACWVRRLARALGVNIALNFSRRSTHLLCPSRTGAKVEKAREWGVPIVDMSWVTDVATTGAIPLVDRTPAVPEPEPEAAMEVDPSPADRKGKGREMAPERPMANITNGAPPIPCRSEDRIYHRDADASADNQAWAEQDPLDADIDTVLPEAPCIQEAGDGKSFGQPNALLGGKVEPGLSNVTPPRPRRPTTQPVSEHAPSPGRILVEATRDTLVTMVEQPEAAATPVKAVDSDPDRMELIPSSTSPSPLKMPSPLKRPDHELTESAPTSPRKLSRTSSKGLQDSISSLLGKRSSEEDASSGKAQPQRAGKRPRPPSRAKPPSRADPVPVQPEVSQAPGGMQARAAFGPYALGEEDVSLFVDGEPGAGVSLQVTYEDAGQRSERSRLLQLLTSEKQEVWEVDERERASGVAAAPSAGRGGKKGKTRGATRRSARVAGF
ncbi:hypothetical protein SCP_1302440 [Sparassis crispa]|uniref:BRCT domain-containing protein n=1 Tax=Sparassis crispa TaxID=139825 RepID=A0A401H207_9APHY|nr:hypothetical protein SCP_1302440 [Sparassis crispa]GBE88429.1 hypothetical protein SCP_1302440 [Sparassis crispa]